MTLLERYNKENPMVETIEKDGFTLEIREGGYFILVGKMVTKKGKRLNKELKQYFNIK